MDINIKRDLIDKYASNISVNDQCKILDLSKGALYYKPMPEYTDNDLKILNRMDRIFTECPFYGHRKIYKQLTNEDYDIGKDRVLRYMKILGLKPFYPKKRKCLSFPNQEHKKYPYLLKKLKIKYPNQVWATDITYIRMVGGFMYLVAVIDWFSRYLLSYKLSNSLDVYFCQSAIEEALSKYKKPEILNSDQGSQFTSSKFTNLLEKNKIKISMNSKGRCFDNIIIERFFRTLKYENIYLNEYRTVKELSKGLEVFKHFYNEVRIHESFNYKKVKEVYYEHT